MSIYGALFSGVSGLAAQAQAMGMLSDNITNVNTVGYKETTARFSSLVTSSATGLPCRKWSESRVRIGPLLNGERHAASAIYVRADHREAA